MIDFRPLIPDNSSVVRGYNGWRCGMLRGYFTPNKRITIALDRFDSPGSFPFPVLYRVFFVPGVKEFLVAPRDNPMTRICPIHVHVRPGDVPSYLWTRLDLTVFNLHVTCPKVSLFPRYHLH